MQKLYRSVALVAVLTVTAPSIHAEQTGCNPHPRSNIATPTTLQVVTTALFSYLGI